jgi:hypothetical protein
MLSAQNVCNLYVHVDVDDVRLVFYRGTEGCTSPKQCAQSGGLLWAADYIESDEEEKLVFCNEGCASIPTGLTPGFTWIWFRFGIF